MFTYVRHVDVATVYIQPNLLEHGVSIGSYYKVVNVFPFFGDFEYEYVVTVARIYVGLFQEHH
jgi:hypothetical protein